ncbi:hypothetical protein IFR04_004933 [Cadophora malorum]|uniref:Acyltransferase 3 domain-containing protein n=1 Tax=Cadophora malorum TaxID=108018 RepID=A0A8H7WBU5_9HELO|nr:hypothetical protein IFR04_004933 [Cadophora malorum]
MTSKFDSRWEKQDISSSAHTAAKWALEFVRPAVMTRGAPQKKVIRTAYLDGLRGFAAFLVYWQHHELWPLREVPASRIMEMGWGYEGKYYFAALPVFRTFFTGGHFAVAVFFVISGYVLSVKPLSLIQAGEYSKLGENMGSALFRRWTRLHLPIIFITIAYLTSWHLFGLWTLSPVHKPTFREELWNWYIEFKNYSFVFRGGGEAWLTYNFPAWSIPVEFRGSIIVYTTLMAVSRATRNARLWVEVGLIYYFMYVVDGWFGAMFMGGVLLCDLDLLARNGDLPVFITKLERWKMPFYYSVFVVSLIFSGCPSHIIDMEILHNAPGWHYLGKLKPEAPWDQKWFFLFWAAMFLVAGIPRIWWLKSFFESSFNQYLGRISFSLYLVHGPILWTLGDRLYCAVGWYKEAHEEFIPDWVNKFPLSHSGPMGLEPAFLVPHLILLPLTLWAAEIVAKICDEPSARFAAWAYSLTLPPPAPVLELHG